MYGDEAKDFHDEEIPKVDSYHTCSAVISLDSALNKDGNYYLERLLKQCKYIRKKKKWLEKNNDDLIIFLILKSLIKDKLG